MSDYREGVLSNPRLNKGTAFSMKEREELGLVGILPPRVSTMEDQVSRCLLNLRRQPTDIERYIFLSALQKRNERLYYRLLVDHTRELMPIVYTPTVGKACEEYGTIFRETAGIYVTANDTGNIYNLLANWSVEDVRLIVVTDGERILGLGDLGTNGMAIPIGKLALYVACAGVRPEQCLPVMLDVGTENLEYRDDPLYLGLRQPRLRGEAYAAVVDEFVQAVKKRYPNALLQFEDFATGNAVELLGRYRNDLLCFNDDIQGTASVALAGFIASARLTKKPLTEMTYMFLGAGSAATGIGDLLVKALVREGLTKEEAYKRLFYLDRKGLVTQCRADDLPSHVKPFATDLPPMAFPEAVETIKPQVLIGASGTPSVFTKDIIEGMAKNHDVPVIFALSNPTANAECTAENAYLWSEGRAVFASGSPFGPVHVNGEIKVPGQGNNAYIFPGLGLGALQGGITRITDDMLISAAETLANCITEKELDQGCLYPPLSKIREVSVAIAMAVAKTASEHGLLKAPLADDFESELRASLYHPDY